MKVMMVRHLRALSKVSDHGRAVGETIHLGARESELA